MVLKGGKIPQNMPLWPKDSLELKTTEKQIEAERRKVLYPPPYLSKSRTYICKCPFSPLYLERQKLIISYSSRSLSAQMHRRGIYIANITS